MIDGFNTYEVGSTTFVDKKLGDDKIDAVEVRGFRFNRARRTGQRTLRAVDVSRPETETLTPTEIDQDSDVA